VNAPKLRVRGLLKVFGRGAREVVALDGFDLDVAENEFVSLVGTSGCGKSTVLSIVAGLQDFDAGDVLVDGRPVEGPGRDRGVVFQNYTLFPWLTARGNVEFALSAAGIRGAELRERAREHLALVGLERFADAHPNQLSGGMKQRVAIARALSYRPRMLLMDEPFGALDALTRHHMQELLTRIWERHRLTVLFITHDVEEALYLSDRVAVMTNAPGRVKEIVPVGLTRPRSYEMLSTPEFRNLHQTVLGSIRAESLRIAQIDDAALA
jgi:NitT/TauT family transport system ATP-binding protein